MNGDWGFTVSRVYNRLRRRTNDTGRKTDDYSTTSASANELAQAFEKLYAAIEARPNTSAQDKADLKAEMKEAQAEAAKGEQASEDLLSRRLRNIERMAPDILDVAESALAGPAAARPKKISSRRLSKIH